MALTCRSIARALMKTRVAAREKWRYAAESASGTRHDLSGDAAEETISFPLDGVAYKNDPSVAARRTGGRSRARASRVGKPKNGSGLNKVRSWARENGFEVKGLGRIPDMVMQAYQKVAPAGTRSSTTGLRTGLGGLELVREGWGR